MKTSENLVASLVNRILAPIAEGSVAGLQCRCTAWRRLEDNVIASIITTYSIDSSARAVALHLNVANASPSVSHDGCLLNFAGCTPRRPCQPHVSLYYDLATHLDFAEGIDATLPLLSGIRQGRSLSETICVLALDPCIRRAVTAGGISASTHSLFGSRYHAGRPQLACGAALHRARLGGLAPRIWPRGQKPQVCCYVLHGRSGRPPPSGRSHPLVRRCGRHRRCPLIGRHRGPPAAAHQWKVAENVIQRAEDIRSVGAPVPTRAASFNVRVVGMVRSRA